MTGVKKSPDDRVSIEACNSERVIIPIYLSPVRDSTRLTRSPNCLAIYSLSDVLPHGASYNE